MSSREAASDAPVAATRARPGLSRGDDPAAAVLPYPERLRLQRGFFARPTLEVARELVGAILVVRRGRALCAVRLVEVEAYLGQGMDPASHSHRGPTPRSSIMFATPGHLYVYFVYGMHCCMNVVCEREGTAGAVLLRAGEPVAGQHLIHRRRGVLGPAATSGPGRLAQAMAVDLTCNGKDLTSGPIGVWPGAPPQRVAASRRIGIRAAADRPYRFFDPDSRFVSGRKSHVGL